MQKQNGKLFVISGPSGAGKGTIVNAVMDQADPSGTALSISMTTREPRPGEEDGVNYFFVTKEEFRRQIEAGGFLEYAEVYDHYYGTPKSKVMEKLNQGKDVILEIDIQGALNVKKAFPEGVLIFILPPSMEVLRSRLTGRGTDAPEVIERRLSKTRGELAFIDRYDYGVVNDDLEEAVETVQAIMRAEHARVDENLHILIREKYGEA
ncbi:guanylate kinase [Eubacterium pyruvativorans]|uniref:guanylate kinase n=1 Tax=Eubacterium pyruvativorans TaxID=155865 RepID=UPI0023EFB3FB|nr:guanylate kinase [Eubacterium pyruvativorans]MCI5747239.1 guanylate kinase [Eubacterium pyruvativorans]MDD7685266.1 guanylate kinase [Eubacterium pyruvativorans]